MLRDEVLSLAIITGEELEAEIERLLKKYGETIWENTEVCSFRTKNFPGNYCKGCFSFIGCKKKYMALVELITLPLTLWDDSAEAEEMRNHAVQIMERIIQAKMDEELEAIILDI